MEIEQKEKNISILHEIHTASLPERESVLMSNESSSREWILFTLSSCSLFMDIYYLQGYL